MEPIRVLIADDHVIFRDGLRALLDASPHMTVVGEAGTGAEAIALAAETQPDVIIMDIQMPDVNGVDATRQIVQMSPHIRVLMLTMFEDDVSVFSAMRAGAYGYMLKGSSHEQLLRAIESLHSGEAIFSPAISVRLISYFANIQLTPSKDIFPELSTREREILVLIAKGASNSEISAELVISPKTTRNHITNILSKLQVADRAQAILRARSAGLV
jgi:DNA-binding NarL/FixJ family response regulator